MFVIKHKNIFIGIIGLVLLVSIAVTFIWQPSFSIEFTGGSVITGSYQDGRPDVEVINEFIIQAGIIGAKVQPVGEKEIIIRTKDLTQEEHGKLVSLLSDGTNVFTETSLSTVGPSIGKELRSKAIVALMLVLVLIIIFVAFAFRSASLVVSSWKFGLSVIICLVHDIFVPTGIFVVFSHYLIGYEIDTLFVTALLAILGYSVADTIVVFDRIRENLRNSPEIKPPGTEGLISESFADLVFRSLRA